MLNSLRSLVAGYLGNERLVPLVGARVADIPLANPKLFAPTIDQMMEHHVRVGQVHDPDFYFFKDIPPSSVFCDIGANLGLSVHSVAATGAQPIIHSFEINPALYPKLREVTVDYPNTWTLHEFGLAESRGDVWIFVVRADDIYILGEATLRLDFLQEPASIERLMTYAPNGNLHVFKMKAAVRRFDDLSIKPDYMKIDAEGAEPVVVRGMRETLKNYKPVVMIENGAMLAVDEEMFALGFGAYSYDVTKDVLRPRVPAQNSFYVHAASVRDLVSRGRLMLE